MANTIDVYGDQETLRKILDGSITEFEDEFVALVETNAMTHLPYLERVSLQRALRINGTAFSVNPSLISLELPSVTLLQDSAFSGCSSLESISLPSATTVGSRAFASCTSLRTASLPKATSLPTRLFNECVALTDVFAPLVERISEQAFYDCRALRSISLPKLNTLYTRFSSWDWRFLETIYVGTGTDTVCTMQYSDGLPSDIQNIYVPDDLVDAYKAATNWSNFASKIRGVSEAPAA